MSNSLQIEPTEDTPKIVFLPETGLFELSEKSLPEDAVEFYQPIINWLNEYSKKPNEKTVFNFKFDYFNTASAKQIFNLLLVLESISKNNNVLINWYYKKGDEDLLATGNRFARLITAKMEMIEFL